MQLGAVHFHVVEFTRLTLDRHQFAFPLAHRAVAHVLEEDRIFALKSLPLEGGH